MAPATALTLVKLLHTLVWIALAGCVLVIPVCAVRGRLRLAALLSAIVVVEIGVLAGNQLRCPLTDLAARYTADRGDNFDIYLPLWLAHCNKQIFGTLFVAGEAILAWSWWRQR